MVEFLRGPSRFWRCPRCQAVLQKGMGAFVGPGTTVTGTATCGACGAAFAQGDVYGGTYDLAEVRLQCPHCQVSLQGPAAELLGEPCPACNQALPKSGAPDD